MNDATAHYPARQLQASAAANRRFQFPKRGQLFIRAHDEMLAIAMRISNPDC
jgi:hypothetical protein